MVMDANRATIRRLVPINEEIERLKKKSGQALYQFRLDKRALGVIHLKAIGRVYGDHGNEVLELLRKNPVECNSCNLSPLEAKALEWGNSEILKREMESYIGGKLPEKSGPPFVLFQGTRKESHHGQDVAARD